MPSFPQFEWEAGYDPIFVKELLSKYLKDHRAVALRIWFTKMAAAVPVKRWLCQKRIAFHASQH
jgi:hypothetical protein